MDIGLWEDFLRILLAVLAGGAIGIERELRDKAAGFRTLIFICAGAALFTVLSRHLGSADEPARVAANIVTGVGFLGAGVILREGGRVVGLTTAATIWLTAAIGMALGSGAYALAGGVVGVALIVLWIFPAFEIWLDNLREERTYEVVCTGGPDRLARIERLFRESGLKAFQRRQVRTGRKVTSVWSASGAPAKHEVLTRRLMRMKEIVELKF